MQPPLVERYACPHASAVCTFTYILTHACFFIYLLLSYSLSLCVAPATMNSFIQDHVLARQFQLLIALGYSFCKAMGLVMLAAVTHGYAELHHSASWEWTPFTACNSRAYMLSAHAHAQYAHMHVLTRA